VPEDQKVECLDTCKHLSWKASSLRYGLVFGGEWNHSLICICTSSGTTRKGHLARLSSITAEIFPRSSRRLGDIIQRIAVKARSSAGLCRIHHVSVLVNDVSLVGGLVNCLRQLEIEWKDGREGNCMLYRLEVGIHPCMLSKQADLSLPMVRRLLQRRKLRK